MNWIGKLADKWSEIPLSATTRGSSTERMSLSDSDLIAWWDSLANVPWDHSWIVDLYADYLNGKKLVDVGSGCGFIGISFLKRGARVTFLDVVKSNLELIERVCRLKGLEADFLHLTDFEDPLKLDTQDCIAAIGSLHHSPANIVKPEFEALASRLKIGGKWLALAYPKIRWEREGRPSFERWGQMTDGDATPWAEWYDEEKLHSQLSPYKFRTVVSFNFSKDNFNWFDLRRV